MLTITENLLLLALNDEKGSFLMDASMAISYGLPGAVLLDLQFAGRIVHEEKKVLLINAEKTGYSLFDEVIELLAKSKKTQKTADWIEIIPVKIKKFEEKAADLLVSKMILKKVEKKALGIFPYKRFPERDSRPERLLRQRIKSMVLEGTPAEDQDLALLGLIKACSLINEVFDKLNRKKATKEIDRLISQMKDAKVVDEAIQETIDLISVAVMTCVQTCITAAT